MDVEPKHKVRVNKNAVEKDRANRFARQLAIAMIHGNRAQAHQLIDEAFGDEPKQKVSLDDLVAGYYPIRVANILERAGIRTLRELLNTSQAYLLAIPDLGRKRVEMVVKRATELSKEIQQAR